MSSSCCTLKSFSISSRRILSPRILSSSSLIFCLCLCATSLRCPSLAMPASASLLCFLVTISSSKARFLCSSFSSALSLSYWWIWKFTMCSG